MGNYQRENARSWAIVGFIGLLMLLATAAFAHADENDDHPAVFFAKYGPLSGNLSPGTSSRTSDPRGSVPAMVTASAQRHGVPVNVAHAIARIESRYQCGARSRSGARGAMQVLPATARSVGVHGNLYDCATGIDAGMKYLAQIIRQHGTGCAALALYNRGAYARPICTGYGRQAVRLAMM